MLCESCWRAEVQEGRQPQEKSATVESEFCCFCALCKRTPPDPDYKMWIETEKGCLCEKCWRETIGNMLAEKIDSTFLVKIPGRSEPLDVQLGCCLLNKKLLLKALDALLEGQQIEIIAENTETMKYMVKKYVEGRGCIITDITDKNGTCLVTIKR